MSEFLIVNLNQSYLIQLPAKLTETEADNFQQIVNQLYRIHSLNRRIVLDFSHTESIESRSISVLLSLMKVAKKEKLDISFWSVCPQIELQLSSASPELLSSIEPGTDFLSINSQPNKTLMQEVLPIIKSIVTRLDWKKLWTEKVQTAPDFHK